jgi:four helix bundle protein
MPNQQAEQLKNRALRFSVRVMCFCRTFYQTWEGAFVADQLFRASARTAANYRAACRARSHRDFTNKMGMAVEEADESVFWLTFVGESRINQTADQKELLGEASELLAIFTKSAKTASENDHPKSPQSPNKSAISN